MGENMSVPKEGQGPHALLADETSAWENGSVKNHLTQDEFLCKHFPEY